MPEMPGHLLASRIVVTSKISKSPEAKNKGKPSHYFILQKNYSLLYLYWM